MDTPFLADLLWFKHWLTSPISLAFAAFQIWMLVDALTTEPSTNDKILWFLVLIFLHFVGALIYFIMRRSSRARRAV